MSDYRRRGFAHNYRSLEEYKSVFATDFPPQARVYAPLKELQKKLYYYMSDSAYLYVSHQCERDRSPAHQPIYSNYLPLLPRDT